MTLSGGPGRWPVRSAYTPGPRCRRRRWRLRPHRWPIAGMTLIRSALRRVRLSGTFAPVRQRDIVMQQSLSRMLHFRGSSHRRCDLLTLSTLGILPLWRSVPTLLSSARPSVTSGNTCSSVTVISTRSLPRHALGVLLP